MSIPSARLILGIETSCDECSASVLRVGPGPRLDVLSVATFSQIALHQPYGGVVPEIASRNHLETLQPMLTRALADAEVGFSDLSAIAVTTRPGLMGALLVGVTAAKALSYALKIPLIPVHHLEGHCASLWLGQKAGPPPAYPMILAVVSGGHTQLHVVQGPPETWAPDFLKSSLVGSSRDDAAGEAFDKTAKLMGFAYPGGALIDRGSEGGNPRAFDLPRALPQKAILDFSFSGLKTAVALLVRDLESRPGGIEPHIADLCASIQEAIVDALFSKMRLAVEKFGCRGLAVVGGVAANRRLRERLNRDLGVPALFPLPEYCTDNAAMIAAAGAFRFLQNQYLEPAQALTLNARATADA
ncbi:MAG TPA: tRNA (adenosine(37)-N6)-threonylcarbamoyltransferase complex transferase subunit TsaD [Bdellovibrionota bacterium]|jgi:N6-L-threonylcarbamoyladenine synthase|nr:tRNA (adenosine(37)-N6)-threonylcarbamoyltransferase complex transferase subunit TsaD [Bdellovibrionota bacterium]